MKLKQIFTTTFFLLMCTLVCVLSIKGVSGNPDPKKIVNTLKDKSQPFELSPERGRYALALSVAENHSFSFTREIAAIAVPDLATSNGKYVSLFAPGVSMLAMPFYLVGRALNLSQVFTFSLSTFFALLNVLLIVTIVRRVTGNIYAGLAAGVTFLFGTTAWAYATTLYQHHVSTFLLLLSYFLLLSKRNIFTTSIIGFLFGFSIFIEYPNGIFFIPFVLWLFYKHFQIKNTEKAVRVSFLFSFIFVIIGFAVGLIPSFWYNQVAYGNPLQLSGTLKGVRTLDESTASASLKVIPEKKKTALGLFRYDRIPQGFDVLVTSQDRGVLLFSPVILLGLLGLIPMMKKNSDATKALIGGILGLFILYCMWGDPWGGWAFGTRYLIPAFGLLAIPLGVAIAVYGKRFLFGLSYLVLFSYSLFVNLAGALTTNQIPPSVEHDSWILPKPTFIHNINLLFEGITSSYFFKAYLSHVMKPMEFAAILYVVIMIMATILLILSTRKENRI